MLKREVLQDRTYALLKEIMHNADFDDFVLFGGTALALQIGHRKSVDLDFITTKNFSTNEIRTKINRYYSFTELRQSNNLLIGEIDGIKVDFVYEKGNMLESIVVEDDIRLLGIKDICAMKLMAISDNGTRMKDYVDIASLSEKYSLNEMISYFNKKYGINSSIVPIRPLCDFSRIDVNQNIDLIDKKFNFDFCKNRIIDMAKNVDKVYNSEN